MAPVGVGAQPWPAPLTESLTGKWIWRTENGPANNWSAFRKKVTLSSVPGSARALIAADSKYWLWINGKQVVFEGGLKRGPNTTDSYVDEVDLAPHLAVGDNTIAVLVWFFGKDGFSHTSSGKGGLFFQASAGDTTIVSDESWKVRAHAAYGPQTLTAPNYRLSESNVEYDAQKEIGNWTAATFDDAGWVPADGALGPSLAAGDPTVSAIGHQAVYQPIVSARLGNGRGHSRAATLQRPSHAVSPRERRQRRRRHRPQDRSFGRERRRFGACPLRHARRRPGIRVTGVDERQ
jgi:hypothetical protein